jgi:cytochrome oxidase Cu insertion factor (SCO1/SenC/PrrC family)
MFIKWLSGLIVLLMLAGLATVWSLADEKQPAEMKGPKLGAAAPDFTLSNSDGKPVSLKDFRGKKQVALVFYPALFRAGG